MIPPMLAWLFRGRSFECMVELGEELIRSGKLSFLRRMASKLIIKSVIKPACPLMHVPKMIGADSVKNRMILA